MSERDAETSPREALDAFLSQAPQVFPEDDELLGASPSEAAHTVPRQGLRRRMVGFLFEKKPSRVSSLVPRTMSGTRTRVFPFNGNGRGR